MGKRQIAARQTRERLVCAAEKLIREQGFEQVGVADIAREAGVAKGSFYTYFKRKEDVVCEIAQSRFAIAEREARAAGSAQGQIAAFLADSMQYIVDTGLSICQQWLKNVVEPDDVQGKEKLAYDTRVIREALEAAVARGELRPDTPVETIGNAVATLYYGAVAVWAITNGASDPLATLRTWCETELGVLLDAYKIHH